MNSPAGFELRGVCKSYGVHTVLKDFSMCLTPGQPLALLGQSGAGKSTILRILAGLDTPDRGQVLLDGQVVTDAGRLRLAPHRRGVSIVFQDLALWPNMTAFDNVMLGLSGACKSRAEARGRAVEALQLCGIESQMDRRPGSLSGGEQQRVALARALAPRPRFVFLDEPFANLDLVIKTKLLAEVASLTAQRCITIIVVTHDLLEALSLCVIAIVIDAGRTVASGNINELTATSQLPLFKLFRERHAASEF